MLYLKTKHLEQFTHWKKNGIIRGKDNLDIDPRVWNFRDESKDFPYTRK